MHVVQTARAGVSARRFVKRKNSLPALPGSARGRVMKQVRLRGQTQKNGHLHAGRVGQQFPFVLIFFIFKEQPRDKHRAVEVRERISETLRRVHLPQRVQIIVRVFTYEHATVA